MLSVFAECWGREGSPGKGGILTDGSCGTAPANGCKQSLKGQDHELGVILPQGSCSIIPQPHSLPRRPPVPRLGPTCPLPVPDDESVTELTHVVAALVLLLVVLHPQGLCQGLTALEIK